MKNFPNPFNSGTTIKYEIPEQSKVKITIYDAQGKKVKTLVNRLQNEGIYNIRFDGKNGQGNNLASGLYVAQAEITPTNGPKYIVPQKLMLVK